MARVTELSSDQLCELARASEPIVSVTGNVSVPHSRMVDWLSGSRPLPGQDEAFFFAQQEKLVGIEQAHQLRVRHLRLSARECLAWRVFQGELTIEQANALAARDGA